jgi:hypothetical protein
VEHKVLKEQLGHKDQLEEVQAVVQELQEHREIQEQ